MSFYSHLQASLLAEPLESLTQLAEQHLVAAEDSLLHVMKSALRCEQIGLGFAAGYRSALQCLMPELDVGRWAAMCVTEAAGNHPRHIQCQVNDQGVLTGEKSFVSMATYQPMLIVVAKAAEQDPQAERPQLKAVLIDSDAAQVTVQPMPPLPMVPEIEHGAVKFNQAQGLLLSGDGYNDYSKRFRTLEDAHVLMGFASVLVSLSFRYRLPSEIFESGVALLASIAALRTGLNASAPTSSFVHLHLAALFAQFKQLCENFEQRLTQLPDEVSNQWLRDKKLFGVAKQAREARHQRALDAVFHRS